MNKPLIGLIPLVDEERESLWMLPGYMNGITHAGGIPIMLPLTDNPQELQQLAQLLDGLLLTGGHDVSPALYHQQPLPVCGAVSPQRDGMETLLLQEFLERGKPVLGICRGIQFLNVALGGTLYQDLPTQHPSEVVHRQKLPYHQPSHSVSLLPDTPLTRLLQTDTLEVNSYHHQAVCQLSPRLLPMAVSPDGLVEAVYLPDAPFVWAVQWHPEFSWKQNSQSRQIFGAFVEACR